MQNVLPIPRNMAAWAEILAIILASLVGGGTVGTVLTLWFRRKQQQAETLETAANRVKILAEARQIDTETNINVGDAVMRMIDKLAFVEARRQALELEVDGLETQVERLGVEMELLKTENKVYEREIQWAKGIFKVRGIPWHEL